MCFSQYFPLHSRYELNLDSRPSGLRSSTISRAKATSTFTHMEVARTASSAIAARRCLLTTACMIATGALTSYIAHPSPVAVVAEKVC